VYKAVFLIGFTLYRVAYLAGVYMLEALAIVLGAVLLCYSWNGLVTVRLGN
jgi:hypothetical protein